mgnify:CR=1 FL=1
MTNTEFTFDVNEYRLDLYKDMLWYKNKYILGEITELEYTKILEYFGLYMLNI